MHPPAFAAVAQMLQLVPRPTGVVDVGAPPDSAVRGLMSNVPYRRLPLADVSRTAPQEDLVLCCEVLQTLPEAEAMLGHIARLVPPGGHLLLTCATGEARRPSNGDAFRPLSRDDVRAAVQSAGLRIVDLFARGDVGDLFCCARRP